MDVMLCAVSAVFVWHYDGGGAENEAHELDGEGMNVWASAEEGAPKLVVNESFVGWYTWACDSI